MSLESTIRSLGAKKASSPLEKDMNDQIFVGSYRSKNFEVSRPAQKLFADLPKDINVDKAQRIAELSDKLFDIHKNVVASNRATPADKETAEMLHKDIMKLAGDLKMPDEFKYATDSLNFIKNKHEDTSNTKDDVSPEDIAKAYATPPKEYQSDVKSDSDIDNISKYRIARDIKAQRKLKIIDDEYHPGETKMDKPTSAFLAALEQVAKNAQDISEKKKMTKADIAALEDPKDKFDEKDLAALRAGKHKMKNEETVEEEIEQIDELIGIKNRSKSKAYLNKAGKYMDKNPLTMNIDDPNFDTRANLKSYIRDKGMMKAMHLRDKQNDRVANAKTELKNAKLAKKGKEPAKSKQDTYEETILEKATYCKACGKVHEKGKCTMEEGLAISTRLNSSSPFDKYKKPVEMFGAAGAAQGAGVAPISGIAKKPGVKKMQEDTITETSYSAKKAKAGKDIGKPGKMFGKIAASAAKRYGSEAAGERVAGAVLAKLREELESLYEAGEYVTMRKVNRKKTVRNIPALIAKYKALGWVLVESITFDERLEQIFETIEVKKKARGRPRKNPLPDANAPKRGRGRPKKVADAGTAAGQEDIKNPNTLHLNLKKAADLGERGEVMHTFANGQTATINPGHARSFMARHSQIKSADGKDALLRHAHSSPAAFMAMVKGGAVPAETKKGITLGGSAKLKALLGKED